ncbi:hypothetical protein ACP8HZ_11270 [Francisella noatunensis]
MKPIFEMLVNDTDNLNKKYNTSINPSKTNQSCWSGGYFSYNPDDLNSKEFYENLLETTPSLSYFKNLRIFHQEN